ncbi:MAG: hypothetical protein GC190_08220 [Alphaproteobacteria bacterium]|nr:hypothetical protein [Alphaproteobacteria bacterium]
MGKITTFLMVLFGSAAVALNAGWADDYYYGTNTPPRTIVIGIDLSMSNPLIADDAFAAKVAARVGPMISGLAPRSHLVLRSFGSYDSSANATLNLDILIAPKTARAEDMARLVSSVIAGVPKLVRQGKLRAQNQTNIIAFLDNMAATIDCRAQPATVILASDGVEDSKLANLSHGRGTLPIPSRAIYAGCDQLYIFGLAQGMHDPRQTQRLRDEWTAWSQAAGFKSFTGLNDW